MLILALAAATTWIIRDTTDNVTSVRDVHALAVSEYGIGGYDGSSGPASMTLTCEKTGMRLGLNWPRKMGDDVALISVKRFAPRSVFDVVPATPWKLTSDGRWAWLDGAPLASFVKNAPGAVTFTVVVHATNGNQEVDFDGDGFDAAAAYVAKACPAAE